MNQQIKPRTIKMKYPATYSQLRIEDENFVSRRKTKMSNSQGTTMPYSHSWNNDSGGRRLKKNLSTPKPVTDIDYALPFNNFFQKEEKSSMVRQRKPTIIARHSMKMSKAFDQNAFQMKPRPDPTVPHLKYGLFPNKRSASTKDPIQALSSSRNKYRSQISAPDGYIRREKINRIKNVSPPSSPEDADSSFDSSRHLSVSAPAHVDIKPRLTRRGFGI